MKHEKNVTARVSRYTHVIWDFNGTILDDVQLGIDCVNRMLARRGLPILADREAYHRVFGFPIEDYYRRVGFDFEREDYHSVLAPEWVALYLAGEGNCPIHPGVAETVASIRRKGLGQVILSASDLTQLTGQLSRLGLVDEFDEILGLDNIHAHGKTALAIAWKQRNPDAVPLFVGDTEHDADVAEAIGGDCILFAGGHQSRERVALRGMPVISAIPELLDFL
jgi:phosphoglycolate phosphatase